MHKLPNPDKDGSHPSHIGIIHEEVFPIKSSNEKYSIIHLECIINIYGKNSYYFICDFRMFLVEYWDGLIFSLFRDYYGLSYPTVLGCTYVDKNNFRHPAIIKKEEADRSITYDDWKKNNGTNFKTRFHLAVLVYFCRFVGASISMDMIKIKNGVPYIWEVGIIGHKNARTLKKSEILEIFDIHPSDWTLLMERQNTPALQCPSWGGIGYEGHKKLEMKEDSMMYLVVKYMRSIDFNIDVFRSFLHLRENEIRHHPTNRQKFPTRIKPRIITGLLELNQSCLISTSPMEIFLDYRN